MRIEHLIISGIIIWAIITIARHANRTEADKAKPSWAVRALNAAGVDVEATRLLPAAAELGGRGIAAGVAAARGRWTGGRDRRTADRESRRERAAELGDRARAEALYRGGQLLNAIERLWAARGDWPTASWPWGRRRGGDQPHEDGRQPEVEPQPDSGADPENDRRRPEPQGGGEETQDDERRDPEVDGGEQPDQADAQDPDSSESDSPGEEQPKRRRGWRRWFGFGGGKDGPDEKPTDDQTQSEPQDPPNTGAEPAPDQAAQAALQKLAAAMGGYCSDAGCTGSGTSIRIDSDGVRKEPCPTCTDNKENSMLQTPPPAMDTATVAQMAPPNWAQTAEIIRDNEPTADYELINLMTGEVAGICMYAAAYEQLHATCVETIGLDPIAVQGLGEFTEHVMELAKAMGDAHQRFLVQYQEVLHAVANGVVLPYNGRWITGEAAV